MLSEHAVIYIFSLHKFWCKKDIAKSVQNRYLENNYSRTVLSQCRLALHEGLIP